MKIAIINDTRPTHHFGCRLVMENLLHELSINEADVIWTWPVSVDWRRHVSKIKRMPKVDAIIINGEGTIHHNTDRRFAQALIDFAVFARNELKAPCYLINATLHKNSAAAYQSLASLRAIYVRDKGSLAELQGAGLDGRYVPDLTFGRNKSYPSIQGKGVCVIDSAVRDDSEGLQAYAQAHNYPFRSMVVARPSNARFLRSPRPWVKNVIRWLQGDRHVSVEPTDYIKYLRSFSMVVTGRYHTVTMCLKNRIPFVCLESNTPKVRYLLEDVMGDTSRSVTMPALQQADLSTYSAFSESELESIDQFNSAAEKAIKEMIANVIRDAGSGCQGSYRY